MSALCWTAIWVTISYVIFPSGVYAQGNVTLESLTIYRTHEWLGRKPSVYFHCKDEKKVELPDIKEKSHAYTFSGHESWQPLTALQGEKCKRCGLYEENELAKDGVFDEWELCPDGFSKDSVYTHFKEGEFTATFLASDRQSDTKPTPSSNNKENVRKGGHGRTALTVLVVTFSFVLVIGIGVVGYTKWQQKKREEQQARFIKLFEEDDDFEREFDL